MLETKRPLINQIQRINRQCLGLFDTLLLLSERTIVQRSILSNSDSVETEEYTAILIRDKLYQNPKARSKLGMKFACNLNLPAYSREADPGLISKLTIAFLREYRRINVTVFRDVLFR